MYRNVHFMRAVSCAHKTLLSRDVSSACVYYQREHPFIVYDTESHFELLLDTYPLHKVHSDVRGSVLHHTRHSVALVVQDDS
jgi:hypothetical protein